MIEEAFEIALRRKKFIAPVLLNAMPDFLPPQPPPNVHNGTGCGGNDFYVSLRRSRISLTN
jgi:hypothetical protein